MQSNEMCVYHWNKYHTLQWKITICYIPAGVYMCNIHFSYICHGKTWDWVVFMPYGQPYVKTLSSCWCFDTDMDYPSVCVSDSGVGLLAVCNILYMAGNHGLCLVLLTPYQESFEVGRTSPHNPINTEPFQSSNQYTTISTRSNNYKERRSRKLWLIEIDVCTLCALERESAGSCSGAVLLCTLTYSTKI